MKLGRKIIATSVCGVAVTAAIVVAMVHTFKAPLREVVAGQLQEQARHTCATIAKDVFLMVKTQHDNVTRKVASDLKVARRLLEEQGGIAFAADAVSWTATNQFTGLAQSVSLPKMQLGNQWLGQHRAPSDKAPLVDQVRELFGGTCTVFQRMNEAGDMLRVCTNVIGNDGMRAIGTFIPAVNPDGRANSVVATLLRGETFTGRAYVVNNWYITAYEPIRNAEGRVVGALYYGVNQEEFDTLRESIMDITVGKSGYVYVLGGSGMHQGRYIISQDGQRDGEDLWEAKDAEGKLFIQSIVNAARATRDGESAIEHYDWKNAGDAVPRRKVVAATYFEPWDWVIGAGAYEDDFAENVSAIRASLDRLMRYVVLGAILAALVTGLVAGFISRRIARRITATAATLDELARGEGDLTKRFTLSNVGPEDEIGRMERHFNDFVEKIHRTISTIADDTRNLADSSAELAGTATRMAGGARDTQQQSTTVAAAAEEMASNMQGMSGAAEQMAGNIKSVAAAVEEMTASISEVARSAEQAADVAGNAAHLIDTSREHIGQLDEAAASVGKVIETIQDIAEQTNLLALNATIEAARAGDAGKGFAVVATEVKTLAQQTAEATEDIRRRIQAIQDSAGQTVRAIGEIGGVVEKVSDSSRTIASAVEEQSITTQEIARSVADTSTMVDTVSSNVAETAEATQEVARNITQVESNAQRTSHEAAATQSASDHLSSLAGSLRVAVGQFKLDADQSAEEGPLELPDAVPADIRACLDRVAAKPVFGNFYHRFVHADPRIAGYFARTDFAKQKALLRDGLVLALRYAAGDPSSREHVAHLARTHDPEHMNIPHELYKVWLDAWIETLAELDPQWSDQLATRWRDQLGPCIEMMKGKSPVPAGHGHPA